MSYKSSLTECVVHRFGGEMLGPVRFDHIETCAREVCHTFRLKDDMATSIATLTSLDDILASLRAELASLTGKPKAPLADGSTSGAAGPSLDESSTIVLRLLRGRRVGEGGTRRGSSPDLRGLLRNCRGVAMGTVLRGFLRDMTVNC